MSRSLKPALLVNFLQREVSHYLHWSSHQRTVNTIYVMKGPHLSTWSPWPRFLMVHGFFTTVMEEEIFKIYINMGSDFTYAKDVSTVFVQETEIFWSRVTGSISIWLSGLWVIVLGYHAVEVADRIHVSCRCDECSDWFALRDQSSRGRCSIAKERRCSVAVMLQLWSSGVHTILYQITDSAAKGRRYYSISTSSSTFSMYHALPSWIRMHSKQIRLSHRKYAILKAYHYVKQSHA